MAGAVLKHIGIRTRAVLLALVPLLVSSLILGCYTAASRVHDLEDALRERGDTLAKHIALESEFGLFSEDRRQLGTLAELALREADVHEVAILDKNRRFIIRSRNAGGADDEKMLLRFSAPVYRSGVTIADHAELYHSMGSASADPGAPVVGWVEVTLSRSTTLARQQGIIRNIVLLTGGAALFSALIALLIGRAIVRPIVRLSRAVDRLRHGEFATRIRTVTGGEIGELESGFNDMAAALERSQSDLQKQVRIATHKLSLLLESLPVAVYRAGLEAPYHPLFITPNVKKLTGFEAGAFVSQPALWKDRLHPDDASRVLSNLPRSPGPGSYEYEYRWRVADGGYKWFYNYLRVIDDDVTDRPTIIGMWQDITEFKRISQKLENSVAILEQKNRELDIAHRRALAASREKATFLANMSHEIRTPLNAIIGFTALLDKSSLTSKQREYTRTISRASAQLLRVIDDILNLSKLESGTVRLDRQPFDLRETFEDVLCMMALEARDKGLELVLLIDSDVPVALIGDHNRINQVLVNLLSNAIKFTDRGGVTVQVSLVRDDGGRAEIKVCVTDTGIGMDKAVQTRIFDSFSQADASISRRYGGTGLGLAIVARLVALWDGRLGVTSAPGKGSTFWFTFTCEKRSPGDPAPHAQGPLHLKALLYDENPIALRATRNLLLHWSTNVFQSRNSAQILPMVRAAAASGEPYDLLIIGLGVEESGGRDLETVVNTLRQDYATPVLLMVNRPQTAWMAKAQGDNGLAVMLKPVRRDALYRQLDELLQLVRESPVAPETGEAASRNKSRKVSRKDHENALPKEVQREFMGLRILLAEDNEFNRALVTTLLAARGVAVTQAGDGREAVALAETQPFDAVILDIHLPGMDGVETARRIRAGNPRYREVPFIALTADVFFADPEKLASAGLAACLLKPLDEAQLWRVFHELFPAAGDHTLTAGSGAPRAMRLRDNGLQRFPGLKDAVLRHRRHIARAFGVRDFTTLRKQVHELKGVTGYFGLPELSDVVGRLEELLRVAPESPAVGDALRRMNSVIDDLLVAGTDVEKETPK